MFFAKTIGYIAKNLTSKELTFLSEAEKLSQHFLLIPLKEVAKRTSFSSTLTQKIMKNLNKKKLVRLSSKPYVGFKLTPVAFDVLTLRLLGEMNVLVYIGKELGVGKESKVYEGLTSKDEEVAVKVLKVGMPAFKKVKRYRLLRNVSSPYWSYETSKELAKREFKALKKLYPRKAKVPKPIFQFRQVLLTEKIKGEMLVNSYWKILHPEKLLEQIMEEIKFWLETVQIVHGDLNQYNILIEELDKITVIDWAQWVTKNDYGSYFLLERDIKTILDFFRKKLGVKKDLNEVKEYLIGYR